MTPFVEHLLKRLCPVLLSVLFSVYASVAISQDEGGVEQSIDTHRLSFNHVLPDELVSIGVVNAIVQDHKGFMWFGGQNGLARYDGYALQVFRNDPADTQSLSNNYVWDLVVDSGGRLWVATRMGISIYDHSSGKFNRLKGSVDAQYGQEEKFFTEVVNSLFQDNDGNIWFAREGKGFARYEFDTGALYYYLNIDKEKNGLQNLNIQSLLRDHMGNVWLGTERRGVVVYDPISRRVLAHHQHDPSDPYSISHNQVRSIGMDANNNVWVGTFGSGINRYDSGRNGFVRYRYDFKDEHSLSNDYIWDIFLDRKQNLWVATDRGGINVYDPANDHFNRYQYSAEFANSPASNSVTSVYEDVAGDLWFGFSPSGVDVVFDHAPNFMNYKHNPFNENSLTDNEVLSIIESRDHDLWVGTQKGLTHFNTKTGAVKRYIYDNEYPVSPRHLLASAVLSLLEDREGNIWMGTWGGGLSRLDRKTETFTHFRPSDQTTTRVSGDRVWSLYQDLKGYLWVGTERGGLNRFDPRTEQFVSYQHNPNELASLGQNMVKSLLEDSRGNFFVGTIDGLDVMDREKGTFVHFEHDEADPNSISAMHVKALFEDSRGNLWVGTHGGGLNLFDRDKKTFRHFRQKDGLSSDVVTGVLEDSLGFLWISGNKGLSRLNPETMLFQNYTKRHGLPANLFWRSASVKRANGQLGFGTTDGFTLFDPAEIKDNVFVPPVVITNFKLSNVPVVVGGEGSPLQQTPPAVQSITLDHTQSILTFAFSALNYRFSENNQYAFRLVGFDSDWQYVDKQRSATYTNLDAGKYTFQVKASNDEGLWNEKGVAVELTVLPPYWQTWWAYGIYLIVSALFIYFVFRYQLEKRTISHLHTINDLKDEFLAKTSHELRTPLNGIIGMTESIISGDMGPISEKVRNNLQIALFSGIRLSNLINDILDFSKLKEHSLALNRINVDVRTATDIVLTLSKPLLKSRPIELINHIEKDLPPVWADENRFQQILYNLVGNAVKFTEKGKIEIFARHDDSFMYVSVKDTGIGIAKDKLEDIFDSYEQADMSLGGTGLGLSVTKQLIDLHQGTISVESKRGKGSTFTFSLPISNLVHLPGNENSTTPTYPASGVELLNQQDATSNNDSASRESTAAASKNPQSPPVLDYDHHILIVEDDHVSRIVTEGYLSTRYKNITCVSSGEEALKRIQDGEKVDIVLLDVMMPGMSGYQVCKEIRKTHSREELPVIFLTGIYQSEGTKTGYKIGANDFLSKPILKDELLNRVSTQLLLVTLNSTQSKTS